MRSETRRSSHSRLPAMKAMPELAVYPGFFALAALVCLAADGATAALVAVAALSHEFGHLAAALVCGRKIKRISLTLHGAAIVYDDAGASYPADIAVTAAGPAVNAALCLIFARRGEYLFSGINAVYAAISLYPAPFLDGGRIVRLLAAYFLGPERGDTAAGCIDRAACIAAIAASIAMIAVYGPAPMLLASTAVFLVFIVKTQTIV